MLTQEELVLKKATKDQATAVAKLNFVEWGTTLTLDQYLEREALLGATDFGHGHPVWVLVPRTNPGTLDFLSSCETYPKPIVYKRLDGTVVHGTTHGIASVFTPPIHRGKGFCSTMLKMLREQFGKESLEKGGQLVGSHLYSDIGPVFYDRLGWSLNPALEVVISTEEALGYPLPSGGLDVARWLTLKDLPRLFEEMTEKNLQTMSPGSIFMPPRVEAVGWFLARTQYCARIRGKGSSDIVGVQLEQIDKSIFCVWSRCFNKKVLSVLWISSGSFEETRSLLALAGHIAMKSGLEKVILWDPLDSEWESQGMLKTRSSDLSSVILFDSSVSAIVPRAWIFNVRGNWI